jgi:uncharacterized protein
MIEIKKGSSKFYAGDNEENPLAEVKLVDTGKDKIIIESTFVSDELRGQSVGKQLIKKVVDFAREENKKIIPLCPYAKSEFNKNKDYGDVLYK